MLHMNQSIHTAGTIVVIILRNIAGTILILAGIVSGFVPIVQGWVLILAGVALLKFPGKDKLIWRFRQLKWVRPVATRFDRFKSRFKKK